MKVWYFTPYNTEKNFGKEINDYCALVPDGDWICIMDGDCMFLTPDWGRHIEDVVGCGLYDFDLYGCYTNRLGRPFQILNAGLYDNHDVKKHYELAVEQRDKYYGQVEDITRLKHVAGLFMLFPKTLWNEIKFEENTRFFDDRFSRAVIKSGGKLGLLKGLYIYHQYRIHSCNPKNDYKHLL